MKYLVSWLNLENNSMSLEGAEILEAKSMYDAKSQFIRKNWVGPRVPMSAAITTTRARCLEDSRLTIPLSDEALENPRLAYEELISVGAM